MDLASLSLGQIASMLSPKQQEVLLASISVAANFIQQIQHEEQEREMMQQLNYSDDHLSNNRHHNGNANVGSAASVNTDNGHQMDDVDDEEDEDDDEDFDDDDADYDTDNNLTDLTLNSNASKQQNNQSQQLQHTQAHQFHSSSDKKPNRKQIPSMHHAHHRAHLSNNNHSTNDTQNLTQSNRSTNNSQSNTSGTEAEADAADLLTIRLFAEELKQRRKSIRLSQKGAAQSLRAFTHGEQPCTDAIIYHFENLQLEPDRAMQLIPLLRDWLDWAEGHRLSGKNLPMMYAVTKVPRERKRKVVLFNEKAKHYLEDAFAKNNHPDRYQLDVISEELNIPTRSIRKWFTNRRQRKRFAEKFLSAGNTSSTSIE